MDWLKLLDDNVERPKEIRPLSMGEVARYGRRSVKGEGGLAGQKSVSDQDAETFDICGEYGLPTSEGDYFAEKPGMSGRAPYDGLTGRHAIHEDLKYDEKGRRRVREKLTALLRAIEEGEKRAVVVWGLCRLWRSVRLCEHLLDFFEEHGVELYDRDGRVDYTSPGGREAVVSKAVKYEAQRKDAKVGVERGLSRNRKRKKIASNPNRLGMRTMGTRTNRVRFIDEELFWVLRIFELYCGVNGERPHSSLEIGPKIVSEGFRWPAGLRRLREGQEALSPTYVPGLQVISVLRDVRYIGYHPTAKGAYKCDSFLREGEPLVPLELFDAAQRKLKQEPKGNHRRVPERALTQLVRCGFDAQTLQCQTAISERSNGVIEKYEVWRSVPRSNGWCHHKLPNLRNDLLIDYVSEHLGPLILHDLSVPPEIDTTTQRLAPLQDELRALNEDLRRIEDLSASTWREDPSYAFALAQRAKARKTEVEGEIRRLERSRIERPNYEQAVDCVRSVDPIVKANAIRQLIRWIAVIPSGKPKVMWQDTGEPARNADQGRLLFCLVTGTYHTAVISFGEAHPKDYHKRINMIRSAEPDECLVGVGELPDPLSFVEGLRRSRTRALEHFDLGLDAPGYDGPLS